MHGGSRRGSSRVNGYGAGPRGAGGPNRKRDGSGRRAGQGRPRDLTRGPAGPVDQDHLAGLIGPVVSAAGMDLESVRIGAAGRRSLVRVVVDADGGIDLDDIAEVSRDVSAALDSGGVMGDVPYTLEVSSPGVDRPLTEPRHWRRAVGRLVRAGGGGAREPGPGAPGRPGAFEGRVVAATDDQVTVDIGGSQRVFSYADLGPGRVQVEFGRAADEMGGPDAGGEPDGH